MTDDVNATFRNLRALLRACGPGSNHHDRAVVLITASIEGGFDTRARILGVAKRVGFSSEFAAKVLDEGDGQRWRRDVSGRYQVREEAG